MLLIAGSRDAPQNLQRIYDYFSCEALGIGNDIDSMCSFDVDRVEEQAFTNASFLMYTLGPFSTLVYVIPVDKMRNKLESLKTKSNNFSNSASRRRDDTTGKG